MKTSWSLLLVFSSSCPWHFLSAWESYYRILRFLLPSSITFFFHYLPSPYPFRIPSRILQPDLSTCSVFRYIHSATQPISWILFPSMSPCSCFMYTFPLSLKGIYYAYSTLLYGWKHELCSNQHELSICHFPWFRQYLSASSYGSLWAHQVRSHYSSTPWPRSNKLPTSPRGKAGIQCLTRITRPSTPLPLRPRPPSFLSSLLAPATKNSGWSLTRPASASELLQLQSPMPYNVILINNHAHCWFPRFLHDLVQMAPQWDLPIILLKSAPFQSLALADFLPWLHSTYKPLDMCVVLIYLLSAPWGQRLCLLLYPQHLEQSLALLGRWGGKCALGTPLAHLPLDTLYWETLTFKESQWGTALFQKLSPFSRFS